MNENRMENTEAIKETTKLLADLPSLTGYPNWGQQKIPKGWLVWSGDLNGVITALTFVPE